MMLTTPRRRLRQRAFAILLSLSLAPAVMSIKAKAVPAAEAHDYLRTEGLSQPRYDYATQVTSEAVEIPMADGERIYVEVTRPNDDGKYPVILEASPYHGTLADRHGTRILPEPRDETGASLGLTRYFAPRGYAVVMMDMRGTGRSTGCLDHLGQKDRADLKAVVEWAAKQGWSNGRVGMTGHSYVGSTPSLAAAAEPEGLVTIVPSAGMGTMYDHQFQAGVPFFLQWAGPMEAYESLSLQRHLPGGDNELKNLEDAGCGLPNSSLVAGEDQLSGRYAPWHEERDWRAEATAADIPVFMVHGVNDNAARVTGMDWFTARGGRAGDKLWLGQWNHGSGCCPTRRGQQWTYALHAWFDKHLYQSEVDTGPPVEMFLSDGTFEEARVGDREQILLTEAWPPVAGDVILYPVAGAPLAGGKLSQTAPVSGRASFTGDPRGFAEPQATGGVDFVMPPKDTDTMLAGVPQLKLVVSATVPRVHVIANLYDESPNGNRRRISQFAINPELRKSESMEVPDTATPIVPGQRMVLHPPAMAMAHNLRAGHKLVLRVTASDPDKVPTFAVDPLITVYTGPDGTKLQVPQVAAPTLAEDTVPFETVLRQEAGESQTTIRRSVAPPLPGPDADRARIPGVTSVYIEFEVEPGLDNNVLLVGAVPATPADIDLYLEKRQGSAWKTGISGTSGELDGEGLRLSRPSPGLYRLEVHNWAGLPSTRVDVTITFLNSAYEPGPDPPNEGGSQPLPVPGPPAGSPLINVKAGLLRS